VERGQQVADRVFWRRCDRLLEAGGELLAGYDGYRDLKQRFDQERIEARQRARWGEVDDGSPQALVDVPAVDGPPSSGTVATTVLADPSGGSPAPGLRGASASVSVDPAMALHWEEMLRLLAASHNVLARARSTGLSAGSWPLSAVIDTRRRTTSSHVFWRLRRGEPPRICRVMFPGFLGAVLVGVRLRIGRSGGASHTRSG
jgi:hypothetical protein